MNKKVVRRTFVAFIRRRERSLVIVDSLKSISEIVRGMEFSFVLVFDNIAEFIVSDNLVELSVGHFDKEFDGFVIGGVSVDNLPCNGGTVFGTIIHIANEC